MDTLSDEMLLEIFEWLPSRVRRESRLVCQKWNRICQSYMFTKEEKIVFCYGRQLDVVAPLFNFEHRRILNLHFIEMRFRWTDNEISFWTSYGERVESIHLYDSGDSFIDLKKISELCPNLQSIKLQFHKRLGDFLNDFDKFVELNFTTPSVTTFHFQDYSVRPLLNNYKLNKILATFPNLTNVDLEFNYELRQGWINDDLNVASRNYLSVHGIFQILCASGVAKNLKKLRFKSVDRQSSCPDVTTLLTKLENIEELTLIPSMSFVGVNFVQPYAPLLKLTELTSLNLAMNSFNFNRSVAEFIPLLLYEIPNLRHLHMEAIITLELNLNLIEKLVCSPLKTLSLAFTNLLLRTKLPFRHSPNVNRKLETLSIRSKDILATPAYDYLFSILPKYFLNVNDLTVSHPTDTTLQHVFKFQERLRKLRLESCDSCTDFGFTGLNDTVTAESEQITYCISELSNLEYLLIDPVSKISERTFAYFVFPKLRTLELVKFGHSDMSLFMFRSVMPYLTKFEYLMEYSECLEVLKLDFEQFVPQGELEKMLQPLKQLRFVKICDQKRLPSNLSGKPKKTADKTYHYARFFTICPLLRKFVHNDNWCYFNSLTSNLEFPRYPGIAQFPELD